MRSIVLALLATILAPQSAIADQPSAAPTPAAPDAALTARFASFVSGVLAGQLPGTGISDAVKKGFTPALMSQVKTAFAPLGDFRSLQFTREESVQGYQRFHYVAIFEKGTQAVTFVIDSAQNIAGFFTDEGQ